MQCDLSHDLLFMVVAGAEPGETLCEVSKKERKMTGMPVCGVEW